MSDERLSPGGPFGHGRRAVARVAEYGSWARRLDAAGRLVAAERLRRTFAVSGPGGAAPPNPTMTLQAGVRSGWLRRWRRAGLVVARRWPWPVSAQLTTGRMLYVDLRSAAGRVLFMHGAFDPCVFDPLAARLTAGGIFLDVGANVGYYTLRALDLVGADGAVHAFEADPRPLRCLRRTVRVASLTNVFIHAQAVGDHDGAASLRMADDSAHSIVARGGGGIPVPAITLDRWRADHPAGRVQAIKIDVEGGELAVLRGARQLLRHEQPLIVCEAVEQQLRAVGDSVDDLLVFLQTAGYRTRWLEQVWSPALVAEPEAPGLDLTPACPEP